MRTPTLRRLAAPALAALVLVGAAGCSDDDGDEAATTSTTATTAGADETTTTAAGGEGEDDPTTTTSTEAEGDGDGATTTDPQDGEAPEDDGPDASDEGQDEVGAVDEEASAVEWDLNAAQYRGRDGTRVAFLCPPDGEVGSVWGTETYTDDSSVCSAAVHAGLVNPVEGGRVVIEIAPGEDSYEGTSANGVTSQDYGEWPGSFTFPTG